MDRIKIYLVLQNAWDSDLLTMPLALGYLKAYAEADAEIRARFDIRIFNYPKRASVSEMAADLFSDPPDILGFSVLGWNANNFGRLSDTYRQVRPRGWCIFGGNHASHQAERVFRLFPAVDFVINGEGEITFYELLKAYLQEKPPAECQEIAGISAIGADGRVFTTAERPRLRNLDVIPSPFLTGALPMFDAAGRFLYDVALMETNRGCPYSCSFCYWGGAIGQKIFAFSRERLRQELDFFAQNRIQHVALCDSNFGMLRSDAEFVEDLLAIREHYGYPQELMTSWAKNKNKVFFSIVQKLKETGFHSTFTLSLQSLNPVALEHMQRQNMKLNEFEDIVQWLNEHEMEADVELIWGAPGETPQSFLEGYDRIAKFVPRIATYPMLILPNTEYDHSRQRHGMLTVRDTSTDFEFVLAHASISLADNRRMHHFLFWARLLAEHQVLRWIFPANHALVGMKQSDLLLSADEWFATRDEPAAVGLLQLLREVVENLDITRITNAVVYTYTQEAALSPLFEAWWCECVVARAKPADAALLMDVFRYDWFSRPFHAAAAAAAAAPSETVHGESFWTKPPATFHYDMLTVIQQLKSGAPIDVPAPAARQVKLFFRKGFADVAANHELVARFNGRTREQLELEMQERIVKPVTLLPAAVPLPTPPQLEANRAVVQLPVSQ